MYAVIEALYPEPRYIKDINSDYQVSKSMTIWRRRVVQISKSWKNYR